MNEKSSRLRQTQKEESLSEQQQNQQQEIKAKEFASVEELLRHDSDQVVVPPGIAVKLNEAVAKAPPAKPWWKRILSNE